MSVVAAEPIKTAPTKSRCKRNSQPLAPTASSQARLQTAAILEVLAGVRRPSEAAQALGTSLPRYYQLERRALLGMLSACEPAPRGPRVNLSRKLTQLERENRRLLRECDRQQALVRSVERSLGLMPAASVKPAIKGSVKGKEGKSPPAAEGKRRRKRRPSVRALKAIKDLRLSEPVVDSPSALPASQS